MTVLVALDETQGLRDGASSLAAFHQPVHNGGTGLPLVLAGLSDTGDMACRMHLARGTTLLGIGFLQRSKAREFMGCPGGYFGMDVSRHLS